MDSQALSFSNPTINFDDFCRLLEILHVPFSTGFLYDDDENEQGRWIDIYKCSFVEFNE